MDYAKEYGIDMDDLLRESPDHPVGKYIHGKCDRESAAYWDNYRRQNPEAPDWESWFRTEPVRARLKRAYKVQPRKHDFTDEEMLIAMGDIRGERKLSA